MSINVTTDPLFAPPRNEVAVSVGVGNLMESVSVWRTLSGQRTSLRAQPVAGFETRTAYDYECPYGVPVTYGWSAAFYDNSAVSTVWSETWASLAAWTTSGASWSVSGGKLVWTGSDSLTASVTRAVTSGRYRTTFAAVPTGVATISFGGFYIDVVNSRIIAGSQSVTFVPGTTTWVVDVTPTSILITTSAGAYSLAAVVAVTQVQISGPSQSLVFSNSWTMGTNVFAAIAVAVDTAGYVYVAVSTSQTIEKYTAAGVYVTSIGGPGSGNGQFNNVRGIAFDSSNNMYVADTSNRRVQKFAPPGSPTNPHTYTTQWGTFGTGNGQFYAVSAITVDGSGNILVADGNLNRIQKFTNTGTYTSQFGTSGSGNGQFNNPGGIAFDATGNVYVSDGGNNRVQVFNPTYVYTSQWGTSGSGNGQFNAPGQVRVDAVGNIAVADSMNYRTQFFTPGGGYLRSVAGSAGKPINSIAFNASGDLYTADGTGSTGRVSRYLNFSTSVDDITLSSYGALTTITEESNPVTLTPEDGWLIHPATPGLSFAVHANMIDNDQSLRDGLQEIGAIDNESNATIHRILGSDTPVTTTNGNRAADVGSITIQTMTHAEELALKALLRDETPILINFPPAMGTDFEYAFHQVGTTTRQRIAQGPNLPYRSYSLPLTQVQSPIVTQQNTGWSYATLALAYASYAAVFLAYDTYADVATDNRRPGF